MLENVRSARLKTNGIAPISKIMVFGGKSKNCTMLENVHYVRLKTNGISIKALEKRFCKEKEHTW